METRNFNALVLVITKTKLSVYGQYSEAAVDFVAILDGKVGVRTNVTNQSLRNTGR